MTSTSQRHRRSSAPETTRESRLALVVVAATVVGLLAVALIGGDDSGRVVSSAPTVMAPVDADDADDTSGDDAVSDDADDDGLDDLVEPEQATGELDEDCRFEGSGVRLGQSGHDVACLQQALVETGAYTGAVSGEFDQATFAAVSSIQEERNLFVDGVVGRETALSLGVWPDEESFVIRTPAPPAGAVDLMGYPLSTVATSGPDAPPLPEGSGTGKRLVYERRGQRVWAVDANEQVIRSWLVAGSQYNNEIPGTHYVYSRSLESTAWNGAAKLPKMVRWLQTERGHIGFHGIPTHVSDGSPYQTEAELGQRLSGGCQRQANRDADFVWDFAPEGTKVVVL